MESYSEGRPPPQELVDLVDAVGNLVSVSATIAALAPAVAGEAGGQELIDASTTVVVAVEHLVSRVSRLLDLRCELAGSPS